MIPVYQPHFSGYEKELVVDCLDSGWISSRGKYISEFESLCKGFIGADHVFAVANGTVALHLALLGLDIGPGDEVIVPTFTYVASVNAISYVGATPVFCECDPVTLQMDLDDVERSITPKTKAVMAVHLYGQPVDMSRLMSLVEGRNIHVIEDAAEAFGAYHKGQHVGTFGDTATFSFFGNKTLTTGEGGLVVVKDPAVAEKIAKLKTHYASDSKRYWHDGIGYNYRMTNIQAAIGVGQFRDLDWVLDRKRQIMEVYREGLAGLPVQMHAETPGDKHSYWMCSMLVDDPADRDALMAFFEGNGIEARPLFYPVHTMPMYAHLSSSQRDFPVSANVASRGINLPSWPDLSAEQLAYIVETVKRYYSNNGAGV